MQDVKKLFFLFEIFREEKKERYLPEQETEAVKRP